MEALLSQFTFLSDQALQDKNFDPSAMEDLMKWFQLESYKTWAAMELQHEEQVKQAEITMQEAEDYLDSVMETAMDEFRRFEEEMERDSKEELDGLEKARKMGNLMEKGATIASKLYTEAAMNSATASMKSAFKGLSTNKVHP